MHALNSKRGDSHRIQGFAAENTGGRPFLLDEDENEMIDENEYKEVTETLIKRLLKALSEFNEIYARF